MKIQFDSSAHLAGIGLFPWARMGPERWFENYKIASLYGWDLYSAQGAPQIAALTDHEPTLTLEHLDSRSLLRNASFQQILRNEFADYNLFAYKAIEIPQALADIRFLSANPELTAKLEDKADFRADFADLGLPFPAYTVLLRSSLQQNEEGLSRLLAGRKKVIVQDEKISGGRGTFVVEDLPSLSCALNVITQLGGGDRLVVSDLIDNARERSLQCVVTRYGTFVGHLQKQIIANPLLANLEIADSDRFCGGEISTNDPLRSIYPQARSYALKIGERLQAMGYRGIFSLDCLVNQDNEVFVLEINPRITGMTPLVTALYREGQDIPFYLLHMLELADMDYTIVDDFLDEQPPEGSLLVMHSDEAVTTRLVQSPPSGLYDMHSAAYVAPAVKLSDSQSELLVQKYMPEGQLVKPGTALLHIFTNGGVTNNQDDLTPDITKVIKSLRNRITFKEATQ